MHFKHGSSQMYRIEITEQHKQAMQRIEQAVQFKASLKLRFIQLVAEERGATNRRVNGWSLIISACEAAERELLALKEKNYRLADVAEKSRDNIKANYFMEDE